MGKHKRGKKRPSHSTDATDQRSKSEERSASASFSGLSSNSNSNCKARRHPAPGDDDDDHHNASSHLSRKRRRREKSADESQATAIQNSTFQAQPSDIMEFPFPTDSDDHCESPLDAYADIAPLLRRSIMSPIVSGPTIYDPYYCNGSVVRNLKSLGFSNVYNRKEDCYYVWSEPSRYPSFQVLVTNPPYSSDHMERLLAHVTCPKFGKRPWFLLLPNWVVKKDYYQRATAHIRPFYLVPRKRYVYVPPKDFRAAKPSDVHKKSSPFVSMWYIWGGTIERNEELIQLFYSHQDKEPLCDLARSKSALRDLRRKKR